MTKAYIVGILVISDTVSKCEKEDLSGKNIKQILLKGEFFPVSLVFYECVPDDSNQIQLKLTEWAELKINLILTVGGTGFSHRDVTPEATKSVIEREAAHIASYMIMTSAAKTKHAVLSRSVCGVRGNTLILNLPGSKKGSEECFVVVASVLPHAMDQLTGDTKKVAAKHSEIQGEVGGKI